MADYETLFDVTRQLNEITAAQLRAVAAKVFRDENMTVGILSAPAQEEQE